MGSSRSRGQTRVSCISRWVPNHWSTSWLLCLKHSCPVTLKGHACPASGLCSKATLRGPSKHPLLKQPTRDRGTPCPRPPLSPSSWYLTLQASIYPDAYAGPERGHHRLRPPLHPRPCSSAWHTANLDTHLLMSEGRPVHASPKACPTSTFRGGEEAAEARGPPHQARPNPASARTAPPQRTAQTDSGPSRAGGGSPKPIWEEARGPCQAVIRRGVGWARLLLQTCSPKTRFLLW